MSYLGNQRGDTLVEVTFAVIILGVVLVSVFQLSNRALQLGAEAKKRTQVTELLQQQAEALRGYRDQNDWGFFTGSAACTSPFHMEQNASGNWVPDTAPNPYIPTLDGKPTPFKISITSTNCSSTSDEVRFDIKAHWVGVATPSNLAQISTILVNKDGLK